MKAGKYIKSAALIGMILLLTQLLACGVGNEDSSSHDTFWFTDPPEIFHTNDVERAQREIPFKLVLPTYLPDNIKPHPHMIEGPVKGTCPDDRVKISVTLPTNGEGDYSVYIEEINRPINALPPPDSESTYLDIAGIQVLEYKTEDIEISSYGQRRITGFSYAWNRDSVHFNVTVYGDDKDEARKIVESMLKQT